MTLEGSTEVPLAQAAHTLGISWHSAYRLVLTGAICGRFAGGRWLVDASSVGRYQRERVMVAAGTNPPGNVVPDGTVG
jgi:hypothetical protein